MNFDKKIIIQKRTDKIDGIGQHIEGWEDYLSTYAGVNGLYGEEFWTAAEQGQENTVVFVMRWVEPLKNMNTYNFRILFDEKKYNVKNIDNVMYRNQILKIKGVAENEG